MCIVTNSTACNVYCAVHQQGACWHKQQQGLQTCISHLMMACTSSKMQAELCFNLRFWTDFWLSRHALRGGTQHSLPSSCLAHLCCSAAVPLHDIQLVACALPVCEKATQKCQLRILRQHGQALTNVKLCFLKAETLSGSSKQHLWRRGTEPKVQGMCLHML